MKILVGLKECRVTDHLQLENSNFKLEIDKHRVRIEELRRALMTEVKKGRRRSKSLFQ